MQRFHILPILLLSCGLGSQAKAIDAARLMRHDTNAIPSAWGSGEVAGPTYPAQGKIVYEESGSFGTPTGYVDEYGVCCQPCLRRPRCFRALIWHFEQFKAKLAGLCWHHRRAACQPACRTPWSFGGYAPEPSCYAPEPSCCAAPVCEAPSCGAKFLDFCHRTRCRIFGWFRCRNWCTACSQPYGSSVFDVVPETGGEELYDIEVPGDAPHVEVPNVPVPPVKVRLPSKNAGSSSNDDDDRVAGGIFTPLAIVRR